MYPGEYFAAEYFSFAYWARTSAGGFSPWFSQMTDLNTVQGLDIPHGARSVLVQAQAQDIRWRMDGGDPATGVGMLLRVTDPPLEFRGSIQLLRFIEAAGGGIINVQFR